MAKLRTDARPIKAREIAEKFGCSIRTVYNFWSQSRADYLAENSISRDKPWEKLGISRATWYRRGKPMPSESLTTGEKS
ncbi:HTH domain-containing protein [Neisseria meningitidis]|uniref:HTH domain-containing protein n=1 Tax=Neisseria TaxID=482 RepID=UPI0001660029|nr:MULTISPECIES: HTH domain-containing protein [Neisseria]MBW4002217.1 HTH domain-containing protein [Neisseria meningitidis]